MIGLPELVILDLGLPDGDGLSLVARIRSWSQVPLLIVSADADPRRVVSALERGADDYLVKPFGVEELVARVGSLLRRSGTAAAPVAATAPLAEPLDFGPVVLDVLERRLSVEGAPVHCTPTEWRLLEIFVSQPGRLLSYRYLAERAWGDAYGDDVRGTLRSHVRALRAKLQDPAASPVLIETVAGAGYRWLARPGLRPPRPAGQPVSGADPTLHRTARDHGTIVHDLSNVATSLRLVAHVARLDAGAAASGLPEQLSNAVARLSGLVDELRAEDRERPSGA